MLDADPVAAWLFGGGPLPSADALRTAHLAAYAYSVLRDDRTRAPLRIDYLAGLGRHLRIKRQLVPLVDAWRSARVDVLLFKSFHFAEFVYPVPGTRLHGDVDVLIRPGSLAAAERVARQLGWRSVHPVSIARVDRRNAFSLVRPGGAATIDVHHEVVQACLPWSAAQRRVTAGVWEQSRSRAWEGTSVYEACPVDLMLAGLILQRCWSGERWWRRTPHDVLDFLHLQERFGISREVLCDRARELRCERTVRGFLDRCDPDTSRWRLTPPSPGERMRWTVGIAIRRGFPGVAERALQRMLIAPAAVRLAAAHVPVVLRARRALHDHADLRALLRAMTPPASSAAPPAPVSDVVAGVRWATRLVGIGAPRTDFLHALATYRALREAGCPVEFVSGVRREGSALVGHAWVEDQGMVLPESNDADRCSEFTETFRYPSGNSMRKRRRKQQHGLPSQAGPLPSRRPANGPPEPATGRRS